MNKYFYCLPSHGKHPARQHGVILLIALVVLLVMTLTVLVLVRTTTLGANIAGNLAIKQSATSGADLGLEKGLLLLDSRYAMGPDGLDTDGQSGSGYYASLDPRVSADDLPWGGAALATDDDGLGNKVRYLVHRLCSQPGRWDAAGQQCILPPAQGCPGSSEMSGSISTCNMRPMYRITARADGPRSTVSYVQMHAY